MVRFPITQAEPLKLELMSFLDAVRDGRPVEVDGEAGMRALHLALALVKSAAEGRAIGREELAALRSGALRPGD
jgi:predicted dehydrogenase